MSRIKSKKELRFYIMADRIMNCHNATPSLKERIRDIFAPNIILKFMKHMRYVSYYKQSGGVKYVYHKYMYRKYSIKCGFTIGPDSFGYGLVIPHYGTIVIAPEAHCGNYCVLHTCTNIGGETPKTIGDGLYMSSGAKIYKSTEIGENVTVSPDSVVLKSQPESNITLSGAPANITRRNNKPWWVAHGELYTRQHDLVEAIKTKLHNT